MENENEKKVDLTRVFVNDETGKMASFSTENVNKKNNFRKKNFNNKNAENLETNV